MATTIDGGRFAANIDPALEAAEYAGFTKRREASASRGMLRGIGVTCFLETARDAHARLREGWQGIAFDPRHGRAVLSQTLHNGAGLARHDAQRRGRVRVVPAIERAEEADGVAPGLCFEGVLLRRGRGPADPRLGQVFG